MCEITDVSELELVPYGVRVVGAWSDVHERHAQYVSDTMSGFTTFTRLGDSKETPLWPSQVLDAEIQLYVHPADVKKMLHILEALEVVAQTPSATLNGLIERLRATCSRKAA